MPPEEWVSSNRAEAAGVTSYWLITTVTRLVLEVSFRNAVVILKFPETLKTSHQGKARVLNGICGVMIFGAYCSLKIECSNFLMMT
jgi:hypothetical protein